MTDERHTPVALTLLLAHRSGRVNVGPLFDKSLTQLHILLPSGRNQVRFAVLVARKNAGVPLQ